MGNDLLRNNVFKNPGYPFISVIIPILNDEKEIGKVLDALRCQTYPTNKIEVIVVDNGSVDNSVELVASYPEVKLLFEHKFKNSPYSARNRGIEAAQGEIVAFLDATCTPSKDWISYGVQSLFKNNADMVGGNVQFQFHNAPTISNFYEKLTTLRVKESIQFNKTTVTANLFVNKSLFDKLGLFPEGIRSGGDSLWTKRATNEGYKLIYCENALVTKQHRTTKAFLIKMWRFGKARPYRWQQENRKVSILKLFINAFRPPPYNGFKKKSLNRGEPYTEKYFLRLWMYHYMVKIIQHTGYVYGEIKIRTNKRE